MVNARSWDSYMDTLLSVMDELKPRIALEFGSGKSTKVIALYPSIESLDTIEHDQDWFYRVANYPIKGMNIHLIRNEDEYAYKFPKDRKYDLVFVDGVNRARCLKEVMDYLSESGVIVLHDAQREQYADAIRLYQYQVWTDQGCTVTLCKDEHTHKRLERCLASVQNFIGVKS